jgi:hypothetical protein
MFSASNIDQLKAPHLTDISQNFRANVWSPLDGGGACGQSSTPIDIVIDLEG